MKKTLEKTLAKTFDAITARQARADRLRATRDAKIMARRKSNTLKGTLEAVWDALNGPNGGSFEDRDIRPADGQSLGRSPAPQFHPVPPQPPARAPLPLYAPTPEPGPPVLPGLFGLGAHAPKGVFPGSTNRPPTPQAALTPVPNMDTTKSQLEAYLTSQKKILEALKFSTVLLPPAPRYLADLEYEISDQPLNNPPHQNTSPVAINNSGGQTNAFPLLSYLSKFVLDEELRRVDANARNYELLGRFFGLPQAVGNLRRFQKGMPALPGHNPAFEFSRDQARQIKGIREAEKRNQNRIFDSLTKIRVPATYPGWQYYDSLIQLKDGAKKVFPMEHWEGETETRTRVTSGNLDDALAYGDTELTSIVTVHAERKGSKIYVEVPVIHVWDDEYDFEDGQPFVADAKTLIDHGGAREFDFGSTWRQQLSGTFDIVNGMLVNPNFNWVDK